MGLLQWFVPLLGGWYLPLPFYDPCISPPLSGLPRITTIHPPYVDYGRMEPGSKSGFAARLSGGRKHGLTHPNIADQAKKLLVI